MWTTLLSSRGQSWGRCTWAVVASRKSCDHPMCSPAFPFVAIPGPRTSAQFPSPLTLFPRESVIPTAKLGGASIVGIDISRSGQQFNTPHNQHSQTPSPPPPSILSLPEFLFTLPMEETADSHPSPVAAFRRRERGQKPKTSNAGGGMGRKRRHSTAQPREKDEGGGGDEDEVEKKIMELQRIVPGGEWVGIENLFEQTATYILALECQVKAMNAVASIFEGLEMQKRKLGG